MSNNNLIQTRKQFVFILNYAVDIIEKDYIEADDLILFSNEVKKFKQGLDLIALPYHVKNNLVNVSFDYSTTRKSISDASFLFFKRTFLNWFQQKHRIMLLNNFLRKYDKNLELLN